MPEQYLTIDHLTTKELNQIFSKIRISDQQFYRDTPCWEWTAYIEDGYGRLVFRGRTERAHRLMYAWTVSPIPHGVGKRIHQIDHLCENRRCCNPVHLALVLPKGNMERVNARTHCPAGHKYTPDTARRYGRAGLQCKLCVYARHRDEYARRKNNPDFIEAKNQYAREYAKQRYHNEPEYAEKARQAARDYRRRQKEKKQADQTTGTS